MMAVRESAASSNGTEWLKPFAYQPDRKAPFRFIWFFLLFVYVLQYPLSLLLPPIADVKSYDHSEWLVAYGFVIVSALIFLGAIYGGMSGQPATIYPPLRSLWKAKKPVSFPI